MGSHYCKFTPHKNMALVVYQAFNSFLAILRLSSWSNSLINKVAPSGGNCGSSSLHRLRTSEYRRPSPTSAANRLIRTSSTDAPSSMQASLCPFGGIARASEQQPTRMYRSPEQTTQKPAREPTLT